MPYKVFRVPAYGCEESEQALNGFLGHHKVLQVTQEFVTTGIDSFWSFCVDYLEQGSGGGGEIAGRRRSKVDYKDLLDTDEFALFARLREVRKELAQVEAVPVYAVFTNEQLAQIVQKRVTVKAGLSDIAGLGEARTRKYGERIVETTQEYWANTHEASK